MSSEKAGPRIDANDQRRGWIIALVIVAVVMIGRLTPFKPVQEFFDNFSWLTRQALRITEDLFESYGYLTVFFAPLLENTILLGALIPGVLVMLLAGLSAHDGLIDLWKAIPLAIAGAWIGDTISYGIGRFGWQRLGPESRLVKMGERMREPLLQHSIWLVLVYHFAGYSRLIGPAAAGFIRMPLRRWLLLDYAGAALWVSVYMVAGYMLGVFGLSLDDSDRNVRIFELILFGLGAIALITVMMRSRQQESADDGGD
jgi:membrane protein DedA with SNARE-associated domain